MNDQDLENHLRQLAVPDLPEEWRLEILAHARRAARAHTPQPQVWPAILLYLRQLFTRNPITAGALTALWLLIFILHATTPIDHSSDAYIAKWDPNRPVYITSIALEIRLAQLEQQEQDTAAEKILRP
jgi:hypothetical protein